MNIPALGTSQYLDPRGPWWGFIPHHLSFLLPPYCAAVSLSQWGQLLCQVPAPRRGTMLSSPSPHGQTCCLVDLGSPSPSVSLWLLSHFSSVTVCSVVDEFRNITYISFFFFFFLPRLSLSLSLPIQFNNLLLYPKLRVGKLLKINKMMCKHIQTIWKKICRGLISYLFSISCLFCVLWWRYNSMQHSAPVPWRQLQCMFNLSSKGWDMAWRYNLCLSRDGTLSF